MTQLKKENITSHAQVNWLPLLTTQTSLLSARNNYYPAF